METANATVERLETGGIRAVISTADKDRDGRIVHQDGWDLDNYRANPVVMWNHEYMDGAKAYPIGKAHVDVVDGKLVADVTFADTEDGRIVESLYEQGILSTFSAGWLPLEDPVQGDDGEHHIRQELLEFSAVPIPSNPRAQVLVSAALKGLNIQTSEAKVEKPFLVDKDGNVMTAESPQPAPPAPTPAPAPTPPTRPPAPPAPVGEGGDSPSDSPSEPVESPSPAVDVPGHYAPVGDISVGGGDAEDAPDIEVNELLASRPAAKVSAQAEVANGEGSAPEGVSGLTTRQIVELVTEVERRVLARLRGRVA